MIDRILAIIFFISTVVLTFLVIKRKTPTWARLTEKLIGQLRDTPPEFEVTYEGRPINDGYRTWIIFFNKGFETIRKADISEKLTVHFKKAEILRPPEIIAKNKKDTGFSAKYINKEGNGEVEINFRYLDHNDGAVVEILHTKADNITLSGNIMGTTKISDAGEFIPFRPKQFRQQLIICIVALAVPVAFLIWGLISGQLTQPQPNQGSIPGWAFLVIAVILYYIGIITSILRPLLRYKKFPRWAVI